MITTAVLTNAVLSLILVVCLILLTAQLFRWWQAEHGKMRFSPMGQKLRQLEIIETLALDFRRKLVLVRRGDQLHLLLCGDGRDIVVETGIPHQVTDAATEPTKSNGE